MFKLIRSQQATPSKRKTKNTNSAKIANPINQPDRPPIAFNNLTRSPLYGRINAVQKAPTQKEHKMIKQRHCMLCDETENLKQTATHALLVCPRCTGNYAHAWFSLAGTPAQLALYDPTDLWNGWHNPLFTLEQAKKIINSMAANEIFLYQEESYSTDGTNIYYHLHDTNWQTYDGSTPKKMSTEQVLPEIINGIEYYKIGYWSWCWEACATADEANEITN